MSGWLDLSQQGLSPCKKRQAYLGAANVAAHRRAMMKDFYKTPEFCAVCHKSALPREIEDYKWRRAFSAYDEWQMSSHSNESPLPFYKKPRNTCQEARSLPQQAGPDAAAMNRRLPIFELSLVAGATTRRIERRL